MRSALSCEGVQAAVAVYAAAVAGHDAKLEAMKPVQRKNAGYAHASEVLAAIPGVTATSAEIERRLKLLLPFVVVVIAELGTIAFLNIGIGHVRKVVPVPLATRVPRNPIPTIAPRPIPTQPVPTIARGRGRRVD
jgi:hypothetical protein